MFLNSCPGEPIDPIGLSQDQYERNQKLIDYNVEYYGFLCTEEYKDFYKSLEGKTLTQDMYESPYFGSFVSSAYAGLDRLYEAYKSNLPITTMPIGYPDCPPGSMMVDGVCVGVGAPTEDNPDPFNPRATTSTINPMLILAAAAAFFFAG